MTNAQLTLDRPDLILTQNFINGQWQSSLNGGFLTVINPATNEIITKVQNSDVADAQAAVSAAQEAFLSWRNTTAKTRAQLLKRWNKLVLDNTEDLARLMSTEQGKPLAEARGEVIYGASYIEWFAEEALRMNGEVLPVLQLDKRQSAIKEPVGVVAAITPWNFPLAMIARKFAPAIAAGCTVVAKPSEDTPLTALALVKLAEEAGLPKGVINILTVSRNNTEALATSWLEDSRVRKITFTGSTPVGKHLAQASAATLKKLSLELGGNAPFLVFEDADLDAAVSGLMAGKFRNSGQACVSPNRIYVHDTIHDEFVERLTEQVKKLIVGPASIKESTIGPMINSRAIEKIQRHVDDAINKGATLVCGGYKVTEGFPEGANFFAPTILTDVSSEMVLCHEETFGPIIPIIRFSNDASAVAMANDTPFGLAAYFYTNNLRRAALLPGQLEAGVIGINEGVVASEAAPFGGIKESGYGREGSSHGLDDYVHVKYLCQGNLGPQT
jgi:succinate-semialdehyde dehydrogenase/glutarate-semialdehyde dehydrogenase